MTKSEDRVASYLRIAGVRHVRWTGVLEDRVTATFATDSFSSGEGVEYEIKYHIPSKRIECSCPNFAIRKAILYDTTLSSPMHHLCKHLQVWRVWFEETIRRSEL